MDGKDETEVIKKSDSVGGAQLMPRLKWIGVAFLVAGIAVLIIGFATFSWKKATPSYYRYEERISAQNGYRGVQYGTVQNYHGGYRIKMQLVRYEYFVNGEYYLSDFIGFKMPFNLDLPQEKSKAVVYYLKWLPSVAVVSRRADFRLVCALLFIGFACLFVKHWIIGVLLGRFD